MYVGKFYYENLKQEMYSSLEEDNVLIRYKKMKVQISSKNLLSPNKVTERK